MYEPLQFIWLVKIHCAVKGMESALRRQVNSCQVYKHAYTQARSIYALRDRAVHASDCYTLLALLPSVFLYLKDMTPLRSPVRTDVQAMHAYAVPDASNFIKLDAMENPFDLPAPLKAELAQRLQSVLLNRYPQPAYAQLKARLVQTQQIPPSMPVMLGNGSDELIHLMVQACAKDGAAVLAPAPGFVMYAMSAQFNRVQYVGVPLTADFSLDMPAMRTAIAQHQPAIMFIAYPNNPTGNVWDDAQIEEILRSAPGLVVIDEAYFPFAQKTWMQRLPEFGNLIVMRTLSKLGLAGIRLGYMAGAPQWLEQFEKVRPPYNVNVLTETAALFVLDHLDVLDAQAAQLRAERTRLFAALQALPAVQPFESAANFILARVPDAPAWMAALKAHNILVKNVSAMHTTLSHCLRLTVGSPAENTALINALKQIAS
jgi:histidinol-phosphate aminotransferase